MDQYHQKKQLERLLVDYFRQEYPEFPAGKLRESESPDFILETNSKYSVGIELTRLYPESRLQQTQEDKTKLEAQDKLVRNTQELFEEKSARKCFCKFLFEEGSILKPERMLSLSVCLMRLIVESVEQFKPGSTGRILIEKNLPEGIKAVLVLTHPGLTYSVWEQANNLGIPGNLLDDIRFSIHKKDEKLSLYLKQNLNEYWLLITTDRLCQQKPVNVTNLLMNSTFNSDYNKVFILELFNRKVFLIK